MGSGTSNPNRNASLGTGCNWQECMLYIINDYVSKNYLNSLDEDMKQKYEKSLNGIIAKFLGNILLRFDVSNTLGTI